MRTSRTGDSVTLAFESHEAGLLRELVGETRILLDAEIPRADPVIARLFPDAYEDPAQARAYDDMVGGELRAEKVRALGEVADSLGESGPATVELSDGLVSSWLAWLTDVRLAVGTRLGVTEETMGTEVDSESPEAPAYEVLHWLGWIQESIIERLGPLRGDAYTREEV